MGNLIFDYDGTLTDIEESTKDWQEKYPIVCADKLGTSHEYMKARFDEFKDYFRDRPSRGFFIGGYDSAPANSDPYLRLQSIALELIKGAKEARYEFSVPEDETKFLVETYVEANKISNDKVHLREGAQSLLEKLKTQCNIAIVTNSNEDKVKSGLESISQEDIPVFGNAKKLFVDNSIESLGDFRYDSNIFTPSLNVANLLPDSIIFRHGDGGYFPRDVHVRRRGYFNILKDLAKDDFRSGNTTVIGDIFELDLALPLSLGYKAIQIDNGSAPAHERNCSGEDFAFVNNLKELEKILLG